MKILFVVPSFSESNSSFYELPLGIIYVATVLKQAHYDIEILDLNKAIFQKETLLDYLQKNKDVDMVCTGGLSAFFYSIEEIIKTIKAYSSDIITILGGGIVTSDQEVICHELEPDIVVLGEGETTILELIQALENRISLDLVDGIGYKNDSKKWVYTKPRKAIDNIDTIPNPDFSLVDIEDYFKRQTPIASNYLYPFDFPRALPILTSRSCPLNCTFCFHPIGQKYRKRSMDKVFEEIEDMICKYKINILVVMDEMMSANKKRLIEFSNRIKKYKILWTCQLWTSSVDKATLQMMKDSGCYLISYGLESINADVLLSMKKFGINKKNIEASLKATQEVGITIQGNFIFGDPAETTKTSDETLSWWKQHPQYHISLGRVSPYPGTMLYEMALKNNLISNKIKFLRDGTPALNMTQMTLVEYQALTNKIAKYSAMGRQFCKIMHIERDGRIKNESYICDIRCPHCENIISYGNLYIEKPAIFKLGCRHCGNRFDVNPSRFPNLKDKLDRQRNKLLKFKEDNKTFVISPAVFENIFLEYFDLLGINDDELIIKYILDSNKTRVDNQYIDKYKIIQRDEKYIDEWRDSIIILMPSLYRKDIMNEFKLLGINYKNIFSVELE